MKIFVTGSTGVIGKRAVPLLLKSGHQVTAVARSQQKAEMLRKMGAEVAQVSLFDPEKLKQSVKGHDAIINVATHIPPTSRFFLRSAWRENDRIRKIGSSNLVDAALLNGVQKFIQESLAIIYRDRGDEWINEDWPLQPVRYNMTVLDAEKSVDTFVQGGGTGVALRFSYFYGPDEGGATLDIIKFLRKGWVPFPVTPEGFMSSISHDDAAAAVVAALDVPSGIYNVSDDEPLERYELINGLADELGIPHPKFPPRWIGRLMGSMGEMMSRSLRVSNSKFRNPSGWKPRFPSVREGWRDLVQRISTVHSV